MWGKGRSWTLQQQLIDMGTELNLIHSLLSLGPSCLLPSTMTTVELQISFSHPHLPMSPVI